MSSVRVLFLAAQVQPYLVSGIRRLLAADTRVEVLLYCRYHENLGALGLQTGGRFRVFTYRYQPETFFWEQVEAFQPQKVFCAGWMFRIYLSWCATLKKKGALTICAMDTQWTGALRQQLLVGLSRMFRYRYFTHAWVPGERQRIYALKLGFPNGSVLPDLYAVDTAPFSAAYRRFCAGKRSIFPKRFLYVGRLESHKLFNFLKAFHQLTADELRGWSLEVYGDGSMRDHALFQHPHINLRGAVYASDLWDLAAAGGVFCLCSSDEPWGMVIQEFAAAGFPLLVSRQCGSTDRFFDGNGVLCDGRSVDSIVRSVRVFTNMPDEELFRLSEKSHGIACHPDAEDWVGILLSVG